MELSRPFLDFVLANAQIKATGGSRQIRQAGYVLHRRTIPDYNFLFVRHGRTLWTVGDQEFELNVGGLLVVPPEVWHHASSTTNRVVLGSIHVDVTLPGGQDVFALLRPPSFRAVGARTRLAGYLRSAIGEWDREPHLVRLMLPAWARLVTLELLLHDAERGLLQPRPVDPVVTTVLEELNSRIAEPTSLNDLAASSGFSGQHLNRIFRSVLGVTPLRYLARLRLDRAASLLTDSQLTIRVVARDVGFDDPYYFSRLFRARFGRSPSEYRRQLDPGR